MCTDINAEIHSREVLDKIQQRELKIRQRRLLGMTEEKREEYLAREQIERTQDETLGWLSVPIGNCTS